MRFPLLGPSPLFLFLFLGLGLGPSLAKAQTYGTADCLMENCLPSQSGYLDGYNFDPAVVGSSSFGQLWTVNPAQYGQVFLAQPITYTPPGGTPSVIVASEDNNVYVLDAATGATRASMNTGTPFSSVDAKCTDLVPNIGITGTPVLDPTLQTLYFWSKGYLDGIGMTTGLDQGRYKFYGVDPVTLKIKFATDIQGLQPSNRPDQYFEAGKVLQRTGLTILNGVVYAGFGGHCDNFNYTGWIIGMDAKTGAVVNAWVPEAGTFGTTGAGIWQAGAGIANDGSHLWIVTGNGWGEELGTAPRIGRQPPGALPMSVVKLGVSSNNSLQAIDFFTPADFRALDAADQDFGSSGVCFLPVGFAQGTVKRLAIANGKNAKAYVMNADNLGGYKTGTGGGDGNLQTIPLSRASFSTAGGYPFEGGYIYLSAISSPTVAYKLGADSNNNPNFVQVGQTSDGTSGPRGIGHATTTSFKGQPGSGLLWITDVANGNVRVYPAVPASNGIMKPIFVGSIPNGGIKFNRVVPGAGRMFVVGTTGSVTAFGSPVNQPLSCTSPLAFDSLIVGQSASLRVTCTAIVNTTITNVSVSDQSLTLFDFPVSGTNLTGSSSVFTFNVSWAPTSVGAFTGSINIALKNGVAKYVNNLPIVVRGSAAASAPTFQLTPINVAFGGLVPGSSETIGGVNKSVQLSNVGVGTLKITGWDFDEVAGVNSEPGADDDDDAPAVDLDGTMDNQTSSGNFSLYGMPFSIGSQSAIALTLNFNPDVNGDYKANLTVYTNGGNMSVLLTGSADGPPKMTYTTEQYDGSVLTRVPYMDFGNIPAGNSSSLDLTVLNDGESALTITKSKPPNDQYIFAANPATDLTEGQVIGPNSSAAGTILLSTQGGAINLPPVNYSSQWVLNGNDQSFGVTSVVISARAFYRQVGPKLATSDAGDAKGTARWGYLGCYPDNAASRALPKAIAMNNASVENGACFSAAIASGTSNFVGTEAASQCFCSAQPPPVKKVSDLLCAMPCNADATQVCGDNGYISVFYDKLAYNASSGQFLPGASVGTASSVSTSSATSTTATSSRSAIVSSNATTRTSTSASSSTGATKTSTSSSLTTSSTSKSTTATGTSTATTIKSSTMSQSTTTKVSTVTSSTLKTSTTTTTTSTRSTTSTSTPTQTVKGLSPLGCFADSASARSLVTLGFTNSSNSVSLCALYCRGRGLKYSGTEAGSACFCGNFLRNAAYPAGSGQQTGCTTPCPGSPAQKCGGTDRISIVQDTTWRPSVFTVARAGKWAFRDCYVDSSSARVLNVTLTLPGALTVEGCLGACATKKLAYCGVENGTLCFGGLTLGAGATVAPSSGSPDPLARGCFVPCRGNATQACGGSSRMDVYRFNSTAASVSPPTVQVSSG